MYTGEGEPRVRFNGGVRMHTHALRPHGRLLVQSGLSVLALVAPISAVLFWLSIPNGTWRPVAIAQVVLLSICGLAYLAYTRTIIRVDAEGISERGFMGLVKDFSSDEIGSVVLLDLYRSGALDTQPQLFVTGTDGRLLVRMRGQYYSRGAMDTVVDQLGVPMVRVPEPMTLQDLNRVRPELLYWFERRFTRRGE